MSSTTEEPTKEAEDGRGLAAVPDPPAEPTAAQDGVDAPSEAEEKPTPPLAVPLPGNWDTISGEFGGDPPTVSEIRLLGGKMPIDGSFEKGAEFDVLCRIKVTGVLGQDTTDDWGTVKRTIRRHMARLISVRRV